MNAIHFVQLPASRFGPFRTPTPTIAAVQSIHPATSHPVLRRSYDDDDGIGRASYWLVARMTTVMMMG